MILQKLKKNNKIKLSKFINVWCYKTNITTIVYGKYLYDPKTMLSVP